ncbi:MAG: hypothetical protein OXC19_21350 [Bryobacterales bacterium]|nr:hypothetical protein [Bryobacterales bacterium]
MSDWQRYGAVEYSRPAPLAEEISTRSRIPIGRAKELLSDSAARVRRLLRLEANPVFWMNGGVQFQNIAGILLVAPRIELEVAPKFLGDAPGWREDFFLLATLSSHGRLLDREGLNSSSRETSDLATLIGRSFVEMYNQNRRRPVRAYRRLPHTGFSLEGDFDPEELALPGEDGFYQEVTTFTSRNSYNAVLRAAASRLASVVPDVETRARLEHVVQDLPRQAVPARLRERRLPSRGRSWQPAYDLAVDILRGFGGTFDPKNLFAPGFVVSTWQIWEDLVSVALRLSFGAQNLSVQPRYRLGLRRIAGRASSMSVTPDCVVAIGTGEGQRLVVVDAKYKGNVERADRGVATSDTYEALAFSRATGVNEVVLVYPMTIGSGAESPGHVGYGREFASIRVDETRIRAIEVGVRGVSETGGLRQFASVLRSEISKVA